MPHTARVGGFKAPTARERARARSGARHGARQRVAKANEGRGQSPHFSARPIAALEESPATLGPTPRLQSPQGMRQAGEGRPRGAAAVVGAAAGRTSVKVISSGGSAKRAATRHLYARALFLYAVTSISAGPREQQAMRARGGAIWAAAQTTLTSGWQGANHRYSLLLLLYCCPLEHDLGFVAISTAMWCLLVGSKSAHARRPPLAG